MDWHNTTVKHLRRFKKAVFLQPATLLAWILLPLCIVGIYLPGLNGPFVFDDVTSILTNPAIARPNVSPGWLGEILESGMAGPLGRPFAYLTFGINYYIAGGFDDTLVFKLTNLLIHIINSLLVWRLVNLLVKHLINTARLQNTTIVRTIPWLTAMLFAVHPIQLTSVLYVVQRMTSLSALFVLGGLSVFLRGRLILPSRTTRAFLLMGTGLAIGLLGLASKENAILVIPLAALIEYTVFTRDQLSVQIRNRLRIFYFLIVVAPLLGTALWLSLEPSFLLKPYEARDFSMIERLLTEARILWIYLFFLAIPRLSRLGLFHDDIAISGALFEPATTFLAIAATAALITVAIRLRHRFPLFSLSVIWFFVAHSLESSIIGLELAHEHRNYLPSIGFMLAIAYGAIVVATRLSRPVVAVITASILIAILGLTTFARAVIWSDEKRLIYHTAQSHPRSPSAQYMYGEYLLGRVSDPQAAIKQFIQATQLNPAEPAYLFAMQRAASSIAVESTNLQPLEFDIASVGNLKERGQSTFSDTLQYFQRRLDQQKRIRFLLRPEISQQLEQLLRNKPASPTAGSLLTTLLDCVTSSPAQCGYLASYASSWALAAASNVSLAPETRRDLILRMADIHITEKNYRAALHSAFVGITYAPHEATYRIIAADMLLFLGRCHEARSQLQFVLEDEDSSMEEKSTANTLLQKSQKHVHCINRSASTHRSMSPG